MKKASSEKINLLLVSSKYMPEYAGSGFRAHNLYKRLAVKYKNLRVKILCGSETESENANYEYEGFNVSRITRANTVHNLCKKLKLPAILRNSIRFARETRDFNNFIENLPLKPDLIHVFGENYITVAAIEYARRERIPLIVELCNDMGTPFQYVPLPFRNRFTGKFPEWTRVVCISEALKKMSQKFFPEEKIWYRPNPVNEKLFFPVDDEEKNELRKKLTKFGENDILLSCLANFRERKNHMLAVEALKLLPEKFKLFLAGPLETKGIHGAEREELFKKIVSRINSYNIRDRVEIRPGFIDNIQDYYKMSDIFLFPSTSEGLGTPMLEAVSCAVPVVANRIPSVTDVWIKDGQNGAVSENNPEDFSSKIMYVSSISRETMLEASTSLLLKAGTEVIDRKYYEIINEAIEEIKNND